jgi:hypothetical protein
MWGTYFVRHLKGNSGNQIQKLADSQATRTKVAHAVIYAKKVESHNDAFISNDTCLAHRSRRGTTKRRRLREHQRSRCWRHSTELSHPSRPGTRSNASYFFGVVRTVAPLALSRSCEGRSRSQRSRHSTENRRKSRGDPMESRVESALACPRRKIWEKRTVPAPIVEPTCAAFSTTKKQPCASNGGKKLRETQLSVVRGDDDDY